MPAYEYRCSDCGRVETYHQSVHDDHPSELFCLCGNQMRRVYSVLAVVFKGSGWAGKT